jgi:hypothetical protein
VCCVYSKDNSNAVVGQLLVEEGPMISSKSSYYLKHNKKCISKTHTPPITFNQKTFIVVAWRATTTVIAATHGHTTNYNNSLFYHEIVLDRAVKNYYCHHANHAIILQNYKRPASQIRLIKRKYVGGQPYC